MPNELERHFAISGESGQPTSEAQPALEPMNRVREAAGEAAQTAREVVTQNPGTVSTVAILFGLVGFAIGLACGQATTRR